MFWWLHPTYKVRESGLGRHRVVCCGIVAIRRTKTTTKLAVVIISNYMMNKDARSFKWEFYPKYANDESCESRSRSGAAARFTLFLVEKGYWSVDC